MSAKWVTASAGLTLALVSGGVEVLGEPLKGALAYQREAILAGEWWRLVTAHVVHLNMRHMLLNVAALLLLGWFLVWRPLDTARLTIAGLATALSVGLLLLAASPTVAYYVGLSGWLHGLAVMVIAAHWCGDRLMSAGLALGLSGKLVWEAVYGANPGTEAAMGAPIITASHCYGALSAAATLALVTVLRRRRDPEQ